MIRHGILCTLFVGASVFAIGCGSSSSKKTERLTQGGTAAPGASTGNGLPEPRAEHTATVLPSGDIFVAGGVDVFGNAMASTVIISGGTATRGPDLTTARLGHSATYDATTGMVIIAGGQIDVAGTQMLSSCELFDPTTGTVSPGPTLNASRSRHAAVLHLAGGNATILFAGGMGTPLGGQPAYRASAEVLDVTSGQTTTLTALLPAAQAKARGALLDTGDVLLVGGENQNGAVAPALYSPSAGTITPLTQAASASSPAVASFGSNVVVAGGQNNAGAVDTTELFASAGSTFAAGPAMNVARSGATGSTLSTSAAAIVGGQSATGPSDVVEVFALSSPSNVVVAGPSLSMARTAHTASVLPTAMDTVVVVGGYDAAGVPTDSIEEIDLAATLAGIAPPMPPPPAGSVTSYPFFENFDAGTGQFVQATTDDFDWTPNSGGTTSFDTGPSGDHTSGSGQYIYTESSYPNDNGQIAIIETPNFAGPAGLELRFWYHMYSNYMASPMGSLSVDVSTDDGATWTNDVWTRNGDQGDLWQEAVVDLSSYAPNHIKVRLRVVTAGFTSDVAIDDLSVSDVPGPVTPPPPPPPPPATPVTLPYSENFDAGLGEFSNVTGDDFDWDQNAGTTTSFDTGPTADHTSGNGQYLYTEATAPNNPAKVAIVEGPSFANFTTLELRFWYHMLAADPNLLMGTLNLDVSTDNGATWTQGVWSRTGDQGANWQEAVVDLSSYAGQTIKIRFRGVTDSFCSDMAIDDVSAR